MSTGIATLDVDDEALSELGADHLPPAVLVSIEKLLMEEAAGTVTLDTALPPASVPEAVAEHRHPLGTHVLPNQTRIHRHGTFDVRFETRSQRIKVFVVFRHPTLSTFLNHAISCVAAAAVGSAVVAAATSNPGAGLALFMPGWKACMVAKVGATIANQIQVELKTETITGPWSGH